ncbi:CAF17-like 4Fe-4S cluster assembly/insertion protein YgfZ [Methylovirgula sp. 4M-Z18]|uniref:CAF17-like 4Fe-4S cluster assembly/insertion protein YgfZ n=1 Tax=Methylovirgula sp. 4M-Z18 TaxID=2293567 RepID=UPI000E2F200D|nr:folate-binding protein YgfZ [Methylovirgula sp. 4M-Z18]RFB80106.1 folate-binding protein [Methylovirgula sp. 4M-Z18]
MPTALLSDRGVVRVSGADARGFLQGLLTCDMDKISKDSMSYGALLTPQGKILFDFLVAEREGGFWLDCPRELAADLTRRLTFYKLRAKVVIEDMSASHAVLAHWGEAAGGLVDGRHLDLGTREIVAAGTAGGDALAYEAHRIALGIPKGGVDFAYGETFPHDADLDLLHGVDFKKGCYVGQEVVSRVEHRGTARKRILPVRFEGGAPAVGTEIRAGEQAIGTMGSSADGHGLASFRVDRLQEAQEAGAKVMAAATELQPLQLNRAAAATVQ